MLGRVMLRTLEHRCGYVPQQHRFSRAGSSTDEQVQVFIGSWHGDAAYIYLHLAALFTLACQIFRAGGAGAAYKASVGCAFKAFGPGSASYEKNQRQGKNQADTQRTVEQGVLGCEHH